MSQQFILFQFDEYYPAGGALDSAGVFNSLEDAEDAFTGEFDFAQVAQVTSSGLMIVSQGHCSVTSTPKRIEWVRVIDSTTHPSRLIYK